MLIKINSIKGFAVLFFIVLCGCQSEVTNDTDLNDVGFIELHEDSTLDDGSFGSKKTILLTSKDDYQNQLLIYTDDSAKDTDFVDNNVLLVDMGIQNSTGYSVQISSIKQSYESIIVNILYSRPDITCTVDGAMTNPYIFVEISSKSFPLINETYEFIPC